MTSSIYPRPSALNENPASDNDILVDDIAITSDLVSPGGGGILRLYFAFTLSATASVTVFNNGTPKGILNSDNSFEILTDGYYRFDIDVEAGDNINLQSSQNITSSTSFFRAHLVQFGA